MSSDRSFLINIRLPSDHPQLLSGLDIWLELGLISDFQVKQICREHFSCVIPIIVQESVQPSSNTEYSSPVSESEALPEKKPSVLAGMLQSLMAEFSVRWLLFLGMFLVVVSSGLLAASQWDRFPAAAQYSVLLAYTLSFFGASFWIGKQSNLRLTAQALLVVTQLLIPVNFWAMDGFKLWNGAGVIVAVVASIILTVVTTLISKRDSKPLKLINILGLSYLHFGWSIPGFPLIAVYIAMIGTSFLTVYQTLLASRDNEQPKSDINVPIYVIIYALLLILFRAIFITTIDITLLGLAIGICGWLAAWLGMRSDTNQTAYQFTGATLLFIGWSVSVISHPQQALVVSGLSLWLFGRRLQLYSFVIDYAFVFTIGLQANWLLWRIIPSSIRNNIVTIAAQLTNLSQTETLLSLGLFPYLLFMVTVADYLRQNNKLQQAGFGEVINLCFGVTLTVIGFFNPAILSINLLLNTLTLATITKRYGTNAIWQLVYLTHITAILTLCSFIHWRLPNLSSEYWAVTLLVLMVAEWLYSVGSGMWRRSAMHIGYGLAVVSFALLWSDTSLYINIYYPQQDEWGLVWLAVPITLTAISRRTEVARRPFIVISSVLAVGLAQFLTLAVPQVRVISLGVATILMVINTNSYHVRERNHNKIVVETRLIASLRNAVIMGNQPDMISLLKRAEFAIVTVGFALMLESAFLWDVARFNLLGNDSWLLVGALNIFSLWLARATIISKTEIYANAFQKWALILCSAELLFLTVHSVLVYTDAAKPGILYLVAIAITIAAILFRTWRQPTNTGFYGIALGLELFAAEALALSGKTTIKIAVANIALGLFAQLFGEWWKRRHRIVPSSFHILPIVYAAFSIILRFNTFTSWTGLFSLSVAIIVIGIGRRNESLKPLLYIGLIGVSLSLYELLFYQMLQKQGGYYGDGLIAMAALGAIIMYVYRLLAPWLTQFLHLTLEEINVIANYHWGWSSFLLLIAVTSPLGINHYIGLATGTFLVRYAIFQGRGLTSAREELIAREVWVYLGLIQGITLAIFLRNLPIVQLFTQQLLPWNAAISCIGAYGLYILPWQRWGWSKKPWQNAAYILPLFIISLTWSQIYPVTLLITANFYVLLAKLAGNFRLTYISLMLVNWALIQYFGQWRLSELWYVTVIGLSLLYIAQFDPDIKLPKAKNGRHMLRLIGSSIICGYAMYIHQDNAVIPGIFSLIAIFAGLALRIRAFLYVGTATFLITGINQLVILSLRYTFLKWVIGLGLGIILISIAANFETRREQLSTIVRSTTNQFEEWE